MKTRLKSGEDKILNTREKAARQTFPQGVIDIAAKHWEEIIVFEPSKHRRIRKVIKDGDETLPIRYQTMTDKESYDSFKEYCSDDIKKVMESYARERYNTYSQRPKNADRDHRIAYTENTLPNKFPALSWWVQQRPAEVQLMHDHTTGLCKVSLFYLHLHICLTTINYQNRINL